MSDGNDRGDWAKFLSLDHMHMYVYGAPYVKNDLVSHPFLVGRPGK